MQTVVHSKNSLFQKIGTISTGNPNLRVWCKQWSNWTSGVGVGNKSDYDTDSTTLIVTCKKRKQQVMENNTLLKRVKKGCIPTWDAQERSQDFSKRGGLKLWKQKPWKGKLACDKNSQGKHVICRKTIDCTHHENWGSFQLTWHLLSLIFFPDDRKTRQTWLHVSAEFCFDLWSFCTVGKHISHVQFSFIFAKFNKHIKLICAKLVFFRFFPIFVSCIY